MEVQIITMILFLLILGQHISAAGTQSKDNVSSTAGCNSSKKKKTSSNDRHPCHSDNCTCSQKDCDIQNKLNLHNNSCKVKEKVCVCFAQLFMRGVYDTLGNGSDISTVMRSIKNLEAALEHTNILESVSLREGNVTAHLYKAHKHSGNLTIYASDNWENASQVNNTVQVFLPANLVEESENATIVFCMINSPEQFKNVFDGRIIGVSISEKNVSGLESPVVISVHVRPVANTEPKCVFYNYTSLQHEDSGCRTEWNKSWVSCSCNHLTYFAVLMVQSNDTKNLDQVILSYISQIGSGLSLLSLVVIVVLYFIKWRVVADQSQQVHISLAVALILLNGHFLANDLVANVPTACVYVAILLHYSLLATFTWTAIEGFHLYLLLLRVFNIYIRRYLLKLSVVGWGVPAVVVILILIIDKSVYLSVGSSTQNGTHVCYTSSEVVIYVTILGFFCAIFTFNLVMLVVVVRTFFFQWPSSGPQQKHQAKDVCTLLGITCLLGISWGLIFFSYGKISTVGLYLFCIFNSLQGFFFFIWFCMSKLAPRKSGTNQSTQTTTT